MSKGVIEKLVKRDTEIAALKAEVERLNKYIQEMVRIQAENRLDGYRELAARAASAENEGADLRTRLADAGNELDALRKVVWWLKHAEWPDMWVITDKDAKANGLDIAALQRGMGK